jgi:hypothetical protein
MAVHSGFVDNLGVVFNNRREQNLRTPAGRRTSLRLCQEVYLAPDMGLRSVLSKDAERRSTVAALPPNIGQ